MHVANKAAMHERTVHLHGSDAQRDLCGLSPCVVSVTRAVGLCEDCGSVTRAL